MSIPPQHTLKPTSSSCSLGKLENEYVQEGWDRDLSLVCLHFPINPRFTECYWHQSKYFSALADRQNDCLKTFFTGDVASYRIHLKYDPFYLQFGFLHPTQMKVNNQTHKVNRVKMLHTAHNYLLVQHHFHSTNPLIHMNSRIQYANKKLTSPYYINYSYIIQPTYCEGALRNFDLIKNSFLFSLLCPDRLPRVCRGRSHEVHVQPHLQPPLQGLDDGQVGQSRAVSRRDTDPRPSSHVAATLQRRPLPPCPCRLLGTRSGILRILQGS